MSFSSGKDSQGNRNRKSIVVLRDSNKNSYSFRDDNPHIVATNTIFVSEENPNIYIKVIKQPSFIEYPKEHDYIRNRIENELQIAKTLSDYFFPVPRVHYTKLDIGSEYITGYIVMDRIAGRIIGSQKELDKYFHKIIDVLNDLLTFGILYKDLNINNFIIGEDDEVYVIDFEDAVPYEPDYNLIVSNKDGSIHVNEQYIKSALKDSIRLRREYRMNDSNTPSPSSSPRKTARSKSPKKPTKSASPRKTAKSTSPKTSTKK